MTNNQGVQPKAASPEQVETAVTLMRMALKQHDLATTRAIIQAAIDFASNDEEALAMGREFQ